MGAGDLIRVFDIDNPQSNWTNIIFLEMIISNSKMPHYFSRLEEKRK
jgi:hypothetical protein